METRFVVIGAPSSAGAYAPGQEKAPTVLREAGLLDFLRKRGLTVEDRGNIEGFRWRVDRDNLRAMNATVAARVATDTATQVAAALGHGAKVLVLGGDCTVELGTVGGALAGKKGSVGLIYVDLDTDLNTPDSSTDGALDWMGVAHLLGIEGSDPTLAHVGPHTPLLTPEQVLFFGNDNSLAFEREIIASKGIAEVPFAQVVTDPAEAAQGVLNGWAKQFDHLLIHLDVDVLDYLDFPLAENTRRNCGLRFDALATAMRILVTAPNWTALTVTEINPDHGEADGSTLRIFAKALADIVGSAEAMKKSRNEQRRN